MSINNTSVAVIIEPENSEPEVVELPKELIKGYEELNKKMDATIVKIQKKRQVKKG